MPAADEPLAVGSAAPDFELPATGNQTIKLSALLKKGPVALFFYPGDNTPGCNRQLSAVRDTQNDFTAKGVTTIGMNPASLASHEKYVEKFDFNFPIAVDEQRQAARAFHALKEDGRGIQRTVYLVGADGTVLFAQRGMPATDAILAALS